MGVSRDFAPGVGTRDAEALLPNLSNVIAVTGSILGSTPRMEPILLAFPPHLLLLPLAQGKSSVGILMALRSEGCNRVRSAK